MTAVVVDCNVGVVANGRHERASSACVLACVDALDACRQQLVVIDDSGHILEEYIHHFSFSGQPGAGDAFFKWLFDRQANVQYCHRATITPIEAGSRCFEEFPDHPSLTSFDRADQKFVAAALASGLKPRILNACDRDWWEHREALIAHEVAVKFLCPELMTRREL